MRRSIILVSCLTLLLSSGCAVFNRNNTPALNAVEQHLVPKDKTAQLISAPVIIPLGFAAATLDMVLLHPLSVAGDAWDDTNEVLWQGLDFDKRYVTTTVMNAPRLALMPALFTGDFLARSSFDISRRGGNVRLIKETSAPKHVDKPAAADVRL